MELKTGIMITEPNPIMEEIGKHPAKGRFITP